MSFYRALLAAVAAVVIATPVFADETQSTQGSNEATANANMQLSDNSMTSSDTQSSTSTTEQKVNVNTASAKDLMKVKGLNGSKARAIVAYRKKHGNFKAIDEIVNVKGFKKLSQDALNNIENQLTIE